MNLNTTVYYPNYNKQNKINNTSPFKKAHLPGCVEVAKTMAVDGRRSIQGTKLTSKSSEYS